MTKYKLILGTLPCGRGRHIVGPLEGKDAGDVAT